MLHATAPVSALPAPSADALHLPQGLWRASQWARPELPTWPTGYPALDTELPGGGWPAGGLIELLCADPGTLEWPLLAPAWRSMLRQRAGQALLITAPQASAPQPYAPGLQTLGLDWQRLLWAAPTTEADAAWAAEQALRSGGITAVLWFSRQARPQTLRRLQFAAQAAAVPLWVVRPLACRADPSPAALRLCLTPLVAPNVSVQILKRQGPRHEQALKLELRRCVPLRPLVPQRGVARVPVPAITSTAAPAMAVAG